MSISDVGSASGLETNRRHRRARVREADRGGHLLLLDQLQVERAKGVLRLVEQQLELPLGLPQLIAEHSELEAILSFAFRILMIRWSSSWMRCSTSCRASR